MKKQLKCILFSSVLLLLSSINYAQLPGFHYKIKQGTKVGYVADTTAKKKKALVKEVASMLHAEVTQSDTGKLVLNFFGITKDPYRGDKGIVNSSDSLGEFFLLIQRRKTLGDVQKYISLRYATWDIGALTIPYKVRLGNDKKDIPTDASAEVNAGFYMGRKWGQTNFFVDKSRTKNCAAITLAGFGSPTVISVDSSNTRGEVKVKSNEIGISSGFGLLVTYYDLSLGLLIGKDFPVSATGGKWIYDSEPWIGLGIGYKLKMFAEK
jgi:hypothetical protein